MIMKTTNKRKKMRKNQQTGLPDNFKKPPVSCSKCLFRIAAIKKSYQSKTVTN
jgi:hypothetical protein